MGGRHYLAAMIQPRRNTGREHMTVRAIDHLGRAFGGILMIGASRPGLLILAALTVEPIHLVGALLGLLVADGYLRAIGNEDPALAPMVRANAILSAVAAAWLVAPMQQPLHVAAILILLASGAATVASAALASALASSAVPPLSAAFAITFGILLMLLPH
ncbi:MAG: urea transporter, partial [Beijerinckiaceae bacterium]